MCKVRNLATFNQKKALKEIKKFPEQPLTAYFTYPNANQHHFSIIGSFLEVL